MRKNIIAILSCLCLVLTMALASCSVSTNVSESEQGNRNPDSNINPDDNEDKNPEKEPSGTPTHNHEYATEYSYDESSHWYACLGTECVEVFAKNTHNFIDNLCDVCGYTKEFPPVYTDSHSVNEDEFYDAINFENVSSVTFSEIKQENGIDIANTSVCINSNKISVKSSEASEETQVYYEIYNDYAYVYFYDNSKCIRKTVASDEEEYLNIPTIEWCKGKLTGLTFEKMTYSEEVYVGSIVEFGGEVTLNYTLRFEEKRLEKVIIEYTLEDVTTILQYMFDYYNETDVLIPQEYEDIKDVEPPHICSFKEEIVRSEYLKKAADCYNCAEYYKSCSCGLIGTESFFVGEALGCDFGAWKTNGENEHVAICSRDSSHIKSESCKGGEATCVELAICQVCDAPYGNLSSSHVFSEYVSDNNATCTFDGTATAVCDYGCGVTDFKTEKAKGHVWNDYKCDSCGADYYSEGLAYKLNSSGGYYSVVGIGSCKDSYVSIPMEYNGKPVKEISADAFKNCTQLIGIKIPTSVTNIVAGSFYGCSNIEKMIIPFIGCGKSTSSKDSVFGSIFGYVQKDKAYETVEGAIQQLNVTSSGKTLYYHYYVPASLRDVTVLSGDVGYSAFRNCYMLTNVVIPDNVMLGGLVFYGCRNLQNVNLPAGINTIGRYTFYECGITSLIIPDTVTEIGEYAFAFCRNLNEITIPDSVQKIKYDAFLDSKITKISFGKGISEIDVRAFVGCNELTEITVSEENEIFASLNGILYSKDYGKLYKYPQGKIDKHFAFMEDTYYIFDYAFNECVNLETIDFGENILFIGEYAFDGCSSLSGNLVLPSVLYIGNSAFASCSSIETVMIASIDFKIDTDNLPDGITIEVTYTCPIGEGAFSFCKSLKYVRVGSQFNKIGKSAFKNCDNLISIELPFVGETYGATTSNTHFGYVFGASTNAENKDFVPETLKHISITGGTKIAAAAFRDVEMQSLALPFIGGSEDATGAEQYFGYIFKCDMHNGPDKYDGSTYQYTDSYGTDYYFYIPTSLIQVQVYGGKIPNRAFNNCKNIRKIIIDSDVEEIGADAFGGCYNLLYAEFKELTYWHLVSTVSGEAIAMEIPSDSLEALAILKEYRSYIWRRIVPAEEV